MSMTILLSRSGMATKTISGGAVVRGYSMGRNFRTRIADVTSFSTLVSTLERASANLRAMVIRGELLDSVKDPECVRRLCDRVKHGDAVTFEPAARQWLGIDVDGVAEPAGLDFAQEPEEGVEHVIGLLPEPFHDVSCWWQATSGGGIKPGINVRLWVWCSRPVSDEECKGWLPKTVADPALYSPVQIHYVAAPFIQSGRDPMARRQGIRMGLADTVDVPAVLPKVKRVEPIHVEVEGRALDQQAQRRVAAVIKNNQVAREIWTGERSYSDRSSRHFAFIGALLRGGIFDGFNDDWAELVAFAVVKLDQKHGIDTSKATRPDYIARTIGAVAAREAAR